MPALLNKFLFMDSPLKAGDGSDKLFLRAFSGQEAISQMFVFQLELLSADFNIDSRQIVGKEITFGVQLPGKVVKFRSFSGTVNRFALLGADQNFARYQAVVVPEPWFLLRDFGKAIQQNFTVPDLVKGIINNAQSKFHNLLARSFKLDSTFVRRTDYRKREYTVQYDETTLNFIMRLLEDEGICFYFKHELTGAATDAHVIHKMLLVDSPEGHLPLDPADIPFDPTPRSGESSVQETITSWMLEDQVRSRTYGSFDFDFKKPNLRTSLGTVESSELTDVGRNLTITEYPGGYVTPDQAKQFGKVRIREEELYRFIVTGTSSCSHLASGFVFNLKKHPRSDQNVRHLITSVSHNAFEPDPVSGSGALTHYGNTFTCVPFPKDALSYRPPRITPKPRVYGCETAIVAGPKGDDDIHTDQFGRVKVQFHWDLGEEPSETSSCFIRVGTPWAGTGWGAIHIPRLDQEVIVAFLYGDPDQPIIVGSVYNGTHAVPYDLPKNKTQSGIKSRSTPKGTASNFNEIRFEDKKGSELLRIHAELNKTESVEADSREYVGNDRLTKIGNDEKKHIKGNQNLHVLGNGREKIEGDLSQHIQGVWGAKIDQSLSVDAADGVLIHTSQMVIQVDQSISINGPGGFVKIDLSGVTIQGTMVLINSGGAPSTATPSVPVDPDDPDEQHGGAKTS